MSKFLPIALAVLLLLASARAQDLDESPRSGPAPAPGGKKGEASESAPEEPGLAGARFPRPSPDGTRVAFSIRGDLWVMPSEGGRAERLTLNEANDIKPVWSPDGKLIAFTSDRSGSWDLWTMPAGGGVPTRLTFDGASDHMNSFTPDGRTIIFQSSRSARWRIYRIPVDGGTPAPLTTEPSAHGTVSAADDYLYYQSSIADPIRKGYRGTANDELYRRRPGEAPERLTDNDRNEAQPHVTPDGKRLFFLRETGKSGKDMNLHVMDLESRKIEQLTKLDDLGMSHLSFTPDFTRAYFVWKFRIHALDLTKKGAEPVLVPVRIVEDTRREKMAERTLTSGAQAIDVSRDGQSIAFGLGGAIWLMSSGGGDARPVTPLGSGDTAPRFSPDGRRIAFYSEGRTGNADLFVIDSSGSNLRQLTFHKSGDFFQNWAPDGSYLVFCSDRSGNKDIWKVGLDGTPPERLAGERYVEDDPVVSPDGRLIAFDAWVSGNADIYVMNADGTGLRRVYGTPAQDESPRFSPDGRLLVFTRTTGGGRTSQEVIVTDLVGSGEARIGNGSGGVFTPDGREIIYVGTRGRIRAAPAPRAIAGGRVISFRATQERTQKARFEATFDEAWSTVARNFYDRKYHGVNWAKIRDEYRPLATGSRTPMEFYSYMQQMLGELSASHQGIRGTITDTPSFRTGLLGCELEPELLEPTEGEAPESPRVRLRVTHLQPGGPADRAWIRDGDYIFGVGEKKLSVGDNFYRHLENTVGKDVRLLVGTRPDGSDMRPTTVKPDHYADEQRRAYSNWRDQCRETVKDKGKGKVAYIHLPAMNSQTLQTFQARLGTPEVQKAKVLIIDVRNNGGGNIHQQLIDILSRRKYAVNFFRTRKDQTAPSLYWDRPLVLLINEQSFSDAEVFAHAFKTLELGTIVGVQTPGAVIGTRDMTLSDGTRLRVTMTGFRNLDGKSQEGNGCVPNVTVEETTADRASGNDPQLVKAIEIALEKIAPEEKPAEKTPAKPEAKPAEEPKPTPEK